MAPRAVRLNRDVIVEAALALIDEVGLNGLTMRAVGEHLGTDPTAAYRHFRSKDDLLAAAADRLFGHVANAVPPTGPWRARMEALLTAAWNLYRAHPNVVDALATHPDDAESLQRINETAVECLVEAGIRDDEVGLWLSLLTTYIAGSGLVEAAWDDAGADWRGMTRRFYASRNPEVFPVSTALGTRLFPAAADVFEFWLTLVLDAIERRGSARRSSTPNRRTPASSK